MGSNVRHALVAHEGARPHIITARNVPQLRFFWERIGTWFVGYSVNHPGMEGQPYLTVPLVFIGEANGFRVTLRYTPD